MARGDDKLVNIIGTSAAVLSAVAMIPQLVQVLRSKDVSGLSIATMFIFLLKAILWLSYHLLTETYHGVAPSIIGIVISTVLILLIIRYRKLKSV